ncbi:MAG: class I SAM-dependent methyltransferase [Candidatus Binataceae bacterium]
MASIRYEFFKDGWDNFYGTLEDLIHRLGAKKVLEIGGGGVHQSLTKEFVELNGIQYTLLDISTEQLARAPEQYMKVQADIGATDLNLSGDYDVVCSHMLAEHIKNGERLHRNVYRLLAPGGVAFHFFPTLYALPYLANRLLPRRLTAKVLSIVQSGREPESIYPMFPAFYSWCRGPTKAQINKLENVGYQVEQYIGFFGHEYYKKLKCVDRLHRALSRWLILHPTARLTSHAYLVLRKPTRGEEVGGVRKARCFSR